MKCVIFAGRPVSEGLCRYWRDADCVIAADAGYETARRLGVGADVLLGDYDSAPCPGHGALLLPAEKDDTDTQAAAREAVRRGADEVVILGGLGGRLDHTIANLHTLVFLARRGVRALLADEENEVRALLPGSYSIPARAGWYFSVFSAGETAEGVTLSGVKYPLDGYSMTNDFPIGVSNEFAAPAAAVRFTAGTLWLVLSKKSGEPGGGPVGGTLFPSPVYTGA